MGPFGKLSRAGAATGSRLPDGKEVFVSRVRRLAPWAIGIAAVAVAVFLAAPAGAQGNIDAGRSPAQIFADTCAACHRSAREIKRPSAGFLRQHYTAGSEEASAMASYLAGIPGEPRGAQPGGAQQKRPPAAVGDTPAENPKQQPKQQAKQQPATADQAKSTQAQSPQPKGRRPPATAEVRPMTPAPDERPAVPAAPPAPVLEPFEE
jgi:mono/diheme cytochrome c family protein